MGSHNPRRAYGLFAVLILTVVLTAATASNISRAAPAETGVAAVDVAVESNAPLTALSVTSGSLNCAQGRVVVGKNGKIGFLAPVIGPNVLRGSTDGGSAVSWAVIPMDELGPDAINAVTTCLTAR